MHLRRMFTRFLALISACTLLPVSVPAKADAAYTPQREDIITESLRTETASHAFFGSYSVAEAGIDGIDEDTLL